MQQLRANRKDDEYQPPMPAVECYAHLVAYLWEVGPTMAAGMGPGPVTHQELAAWQSLTGIELSAWEARSLRRLSVEYIGQMSKAEKASCSPPWHPESHEIDKVDVARSLRDTIRAMAA